MKIVNENPRPLTETVRHTPTPPTVGDMTKARKERNWKYTPTISNDHMRQ